VLRIASAADPTRLRRADRRRRRRYRHSDEVVMPPTLTDHNLRDTATGRWAGRVKFSERSWTR
jgi:hypothetical protein